MRRSLSIVVVLLALVPTIQPAAASPPLRTLTRRWGLLQVGPREHSLQIREAGGLCESSPVAHVVESPRTVRIRVTTKELFREETHGDEATVCPAMEVVHMLTIHLRYPLAGRSIRGGVLSESEKGAVPRVVGLAPAVARSLLGHNRLRSVVKVVGRGGGLPRVVAQTPAPDTPQRDAHIVRLFVRQ
jgi:hypothetical protein